MTHVSFDGGGLQPIQVQEKPLNAETPLEALAEPYTPTRLFYIRNHFDVPAVDAPAWRLTIDGAVARTLQLSLGDLLGRSPQTLPVTLECAGNGRKYMTPVPPGVAWGYGAVGTARFTGVPLGPLLREAGLQADAVEIAFEGADEGDVGGQPVPYVRSLPVDVALAPDTLLAWRMNDEPLTLEHGFPLRLVVPRWYGMASVKWLCRITALRAPFAGCFQQEYVYSDATGAEPVRLSRVRALIARPADREKLTVESVEIAGTAWSGVAPIRQVEISTDGGLSWGCAELGAAPSPISARPWRFAWRPSASGAYVLVARATDAAGNTQPLDAPWNARGYGNNVAQRVSVSVRA